VSGVAAPLAVQFMPPVTGPIELRVPYATTARRATPRVVDNHGDLEDEVFDYGGR
jgi:hypothetical protein